MNKWVKEWIKETITINTYIYKSTTCKTKLYSNLLFWQSIYKRLHPTAISTQPCQFCSWPPCPPSGLCYMPFRMVVTIHNSQFMVVTFSQIMLKTFTRAVDNVITNIAKDINRKYNSNMCCCMNNKQLIQLSTPNYSKLFTTFDALGYDLKMIILQNRENIFHKHLHVCLF